MSCSAKCIINLNFGFLSSGLTEIFDGIAPLCSKKIAEGPIFKNTGEQDREKIVDSERIKPNVQVITVGARGSALSRAQMQEVLIELQKFHPQIEFQPLWVETSGDKDLQTSLRTLEKTDFFTKEIDTAQLAGQCRISIHSAKDLPDPLPSGLLLVALTRGVDPSDSIVLRESETLENLPSGAKIGTSSLRREKNIRDLRPDFLCVDIRGSIQTRLALLDGGNVDGVVIAEAALIRLQLTDRNRIPLPGDRAHLQGQLAVVAIDGDEEMQRLFQCMNVRKNENDALLGNRSDAI